MTISDKSRKLLWGKAGSLCAFCKCNLFKDANENDNNSVIGDECHVVSEKKEGPRYNSNFPSGNIDTYSNLILLCKNHHKMVDDQFETFNTNVLNEIKRNHEEWVKSRLLGNNDKRIIIKRIKQNIPKHLLQIKDGNYLSSLLSSVCHFYPSYDKLETEQEVELVGNFFQSLQDLGDIIDEFGISEQMKYSMQLTNEIKELENKGFYVFGGNEDQILTGNGEETSWKAVYVHVARKNSNQLIFIDPKENR
jgi:hypothetical protein